MSAIQGNVAHVESEQLVKNIVSSDETARQRPSRRRSESHFNVGDVNVLPNMGLSYTVPVSDSTTSSMYAIVNILDSLILAASGLE